MNKIKGKVDVMIASKDRWSELALALQSLRTQTYQNFDVYILDDQSGSNVAQCEFLNKLCNRMRIEGHKVKISRNNYSYGVCFARNELIKIVKNEGTGEYCLRLDDDVICENDYIEKLVHTIEQTGAGLVSGVTPLLALPDHERELKYVVPIINKLEYDNNGNLTKIGDDCGFSYLHESIIPTHHFRSCALYRSELHELFAYPVNLSPAGFREEAFFSINTILHGWTLYVNTHAKVYHLVTNSGGCRANPQAYQQNVHTDDLTFKEWFKAKIELNGDFIKKYNEKVIP